MSKSKEEKTYNLGRKVRSPQQKEEFVPYTEAIRGTQEHQMYMTVEREGVSRPTLYGYYNRIMLDFQNERKLEEATCKRYDNIVCTLIAPAFAEYALSEMDEMDYIECWQRVLKSTESPAKLDEAYALIRMIAEYAYRHGDTPMSLWGILTEERGAAFRGKGEAVENVTIKQEIRRYVERGIRISHSISLATEFKLFLLMLQQVTKFGQSLAGLILFSIGVRTSEAVAFCFKHLTEVYPGCWALQRINVSEPDARNSEMGGKSHNAFRLLWIPEFLAKLILDKRERLLTIYPQEVVNEFTIACCGDDYKRPCTQRELNAHMKELFRLAGVKEDMIASAFCEMRDSKEAMEEYERSITAYLGRHQAITAMVYCGLNEAQICACAGHEQVEEGVKAYDFANPDTFRELVNALSRRPIFQILNQMSEYDVISYEGGMTTFSSDGWSRVVFQSDQEIEFMLLAYSSVGATTLEMEATEHVQIMDKIKVHFPKAIGGRELSIRRGLRVVGENAYLAAMNDLENALPVGECAVEDPEWMDQIAEADIQVYEEEPPEVVPLPEIQELLPKKGEGKQEGSKMEEVNEERKQPKPELVEQCANGDTRLYLVDQTGEVRDLNDTVQPLLCRRGIRGQKVLQKQNAVAMYAYQPHHPAYVISRQGWMYCVPAGGLMGRSGEVYRNVLCDRGILLQDSAMVQTDASLVCLTATGNVIRLSADRLTGTFPEEGRRLIDVGKGEVWNDEVVSACVWPARSDILLVTKNGQALRIEDESLRVCRSFSLKPIKGISLEDGDRAVACVPYTKAGIFSVTADGLGRLFQEKPDINPHGRGSKGVAFLKLRDGDHIINAVVPSRVVGMLRKDGYLCCTDVNQFPKQGKNSMGVAAMKTEREKYIVAVISFPDVSSK